MQSKSKNKRSKLPFAIVGVVAVIAAVVVLEATNTTHIFHKTAKVSAPTRPITQLTPQPAPTKNPSTPTSTVTEGTATDKNGQVPNGISNDPSQWAVSASGKVTLKAPLNNANFQSGDTITGSASETPLQYRLVDNQAGVIAQGPLNVVNGNFTATLNFKPYGSGGRLDIFNVDANAREINEVQVELTF